MTKRWNWGWAAGLILLAAAVVLPQGVWADEHGDEREHGERHEEEQEHHGEAWEYAEDEAERHGEEHESGHGAGFYEQIEALAEEAERVFSEEVEGFLAEVLPEALEHVHAMAAQVEEALASPEIRRQLYETKMHLAQMARQLSSARHTDPEMFERIREQQRLEMQSHLLAEEFHRTDSEEARQRIREELREIIEQGFALSQEIREFEAAQIERELDKVRTMLEKRRQNKQIIIERRMHELLENDDPFKW